MMVRNGNGSALCPVMDSNRDGKMRFVSEFAHQMPKNGRKTGDFGALPIVTISGVRSGKNYRSKAVISGAKARAIFDTFSLKSVGYSRFLSLNENVEACHLPPPFFCLFSGEKGKKNATA